MVQHLQQYDPRRACSLPVLFIGRQAPDRIMKLQHMPTNLKRWQRRRTWAADVKVCVMLCGAA